MHTHCIHYYCSACPSLPASSRASSKSTAEIWQQSAVILNILSTHFSRSGTAWLGTQVLRLGRAWVSLRLWTCGRLHSRGRFFRFCHQKRRHTESTRRHCRWRGWMGTHLLHMCRPCWLWDWDARSSIFFFPLESIREANSTKVPGTIPLRCPVSFSTQCMQVA